MTWNLFGQMPPSVKVASFVVGIVAAAIVVGCSRATPAPELLAGAERALLESDSDRVEELVRQISPESNEWQAAQLLAGEAATKAGRFESAIEYYLAAVEFDDTTPDGLLARFSAAEIYLELGQLTQAENFYRQVLSAQPGNGLTNERMAFLLSMTGRRWAALDHYFVLIKGGEAGYRELALAADVGRSIEQAEFLEKCKRLCPTDKLVRLALATHSYDEGHSDAQELLKQLSSQFPELIAAQSMWGELLVDDSSRTAFLNWHESLPSAAEDSPDIWFVRGLWARKQSDLEAARECFWQTVIRTPFHRRALYMLGQVLLALDDPQADQVAEYAQSLIHLSQSIDQVLISKGNSEKNFHETTRLLEQLGRLWEACAWSVVGRERFPDSNWPSETLSRHGYKLTTELPWIQVEKNPVANRKKSSVPHFDRLLAKVSTDSKSVRGAATSETVDEAEIRFEEVSLIPFQYFNSEDLSTKGVRTFEQTGGGVAIIDFDSDGYPDVFLSQGSKWNTGEDQPAASVVHSDKLFRNADGESFIDASSGLTGLDSGYGQGCSGGDFNNDGFTDLYVANVGKNCLYQNLGDGTFEVVTELAGLTDDSWTVSSMVADLNSDGLPDLLDVNYLMGEGVFERICEGRACSPSVFPGAPDRILINQGNGEFAEAKDATPLKETKGLGVVAFELEPNRRPKLFVANDQVANFFLDNLPTEDADEINLKNHANVAGLAFNDDGLPMACMGVAIDDFDGNGSLDLFVTNFQNEANTLYLQDSPGLFGDATKAAGLEAASIPYTGWGTQSLDADLDGWPDLVIANGHVDDYRDEGGEYHMRPQFFRNLRGKFHELMPDSVGRWFADKYLGRGLARVDWNRDGLPEFIVSNINSPLALMKNVSINTGHFLKVKLIATQTARDAIGARVSLQLGDRSVTRQLVSGDGYMASNERVVNFGLAGSDRIDRLVVHWPSGAKTTLESLPADSALKIVEGSKLATVSDASSIESLAVLPSDEGNR